MARWEVMVRFQSSRGASPDSSSFRRLRLSSLVPRLLHSPVPVESYVPRSPPSEHSARRTAREATDVLD
jgi:hypothetical protein